MGRPRLNNAGDRYGKWTLIEPVYKGRKWKCKCDCGTIREVRTDVLRSNKSLSCGCDTKRIQRESKIKQGTKYSLEGKRFGRWTVIRYAGRSKWLCRCDCGTERNIQTGQLTNGYATMCKKCSAKENSGVRTHGLSGTKLYRVYFAMHSRCESPEKPEYKRYGGRGITVCDEWSGENGFEHFAEWSINNGYGIKKEIDREDNDKGYSPNNCRWVTRQTNMNNTSTNRFVEINGKTQTVAEWAREYGIPYSLFYTRLIKLGWSIEETINTEKLPRGTKHGRHI